MRSILEMSWDTGLHQTTIRLRLTKKPELAHYCETRKKIVVDSEKFKAIIWRPKGRPISYNYERETKKHA